jgi:hypothetical protein
MLVDADFDETTHVPKRTQNYFRVSFSLRNQESKDTVFSSVDYAKLNSAVANAFDIGEKRTKERVLLL